MEAFRPHGGSAPGLDAYLGVLREAEITKGLNKHILRDASDHRKLLALVDKYGDEFHVLNVCTLFHRLARCLAKNPKTFSENTRAVQASASWQKLLGLVRKHASQCNNMELTNCLWAMATMEVRGEENTALMLKSLAATYLDSFEPRNLALSAWALAKMGYTDPEWCRSWADKVLKRLPEFESRDKTMVVWAFATVHWRDEAFLKRFCEEVEADCENYGNQDIGNTLWALATLSCRNEGALAALVAQCFQKAETFDQQNLSIIMWSFATLGYKNMNLLHYLTQQATEKIQTFVSQGMANIVWACAKFQFQQKCLLMTVAEEAIPRLDEFEPQHVAIMAWAYATLEFPNRPLLTALCQAASRKMHIFGAQHMANMTWAMATLAHKDEEYLRLLTHRALEQVEEFNPQECSNLAWAFALLTFRDDELLAGLSKRSQEIVEQFIPQNLGNTAWAYNRLGFRDEALMECLVREAAHRLHECQGQEIFDLIEAVATGDYSDVMGLPEWQIVNAWTTEKYDRIAHFLDHNSDLPLTFPGLSEFDRALAVQDYRDSLGSFNLIGLGYTNTARLLVHLGIQIPDGAALQAWIAEAQMAASSARNEGDAEKNKEAQEGLKACRTVCVYRFSLAVTMALSPEHTGATVDQGPVGVASGPGNEAHELGLFAGSLKHNRGGDGEFQALQACSRACVDLGISPLTNGSQVEGEIWLYVTEVPCMSCVGAMAQFRRLFPNILMHVYFVLGRQPATTKTSLADSCSEVANAPHAYIGNLETRSSTNGMKTMSKSAGGINGRALGAQHGTGKRPGSVPHSGSARAGSRMGHSSWEEALLQEDALGRGLTANGNAQASKTQAAPSSWEEALREEERLGLGKTEVASEGLPRVSVAPKASNGYPVATAVQGLSKQQGNVTNGQAQHKQGLDTQALPLVKGVHENVRVADSSNALTENLDTDDQVDVKWRYISAGTNSSARQSFY